MTPKNIGFGEYARQILEREQERAKNIRRVVEKVRTERRSAPSEWTGELTAHGQKRPNCTIGGTLTSVLGTLKVLGEGSLDATLIAPDGERVEFGTYSDTIVDGIRADLTTTELP